MGISSPHLWITSSSAYPCIFFLMEVLEYPFVGTKKYFEHFSTYLGTFQVER